MVIYGAVENHVGLVLNGMGGALQAGTLQAGGLQVLGQVTLSLDAKVLVLKRLSAVRCAGFVTSRRCGAG